MPGAEPFMEWVVETVLPGEVRKLTSAIEEKEAALTHHDNQIQALEFVNEEHQQKMLRLNEEINDLRLMRSKRVVGKGIHIMLFDVNICSWKTISNSLNFVTQI